VALVSADAEFSRNPILGAKANAEKHGFQIVHEATYPLTTEDFAPVIDAAAASACDLLFLCSYLADSIGLVRTIRAHRFRPKMVGGAMIGPQNTAVKTTLGPLLNGFVNYEYWVPAPKRMFPSVQEMLNTYQARAGDNGVDSGTLYGATGLRPNAGGGSSRRSDRRLQRRKPCSVCTRCDVSHRDGRHQIWDEWRMGRATRLAGPVSGNIRP
jgi:ABC-type branched-subunit amino acid transport system substrate-binding protein